MEDERTHILIVEDSEDDRDMYAHHLSMKGYRVSKAGDGKEGLEKALELHPHLILIDLWLPIMGGWELTQRLKANERTNHSPVLILTGHSLFQPSTLECDGWLTKPCPLNQLDEEIARILKARGEGKGLSQPTARAEPPSGVTREPLIQPTDDRLPISNRSPALAGIKAGNSARE